VARGHVRAFEVPEAAGERFIIGAGPFAGQDVVDVRRDICGGQLSASLICRHCTRPSPI